MKKLFFIAAGLILALTACQKDETTGPDSGTVSSSFTVTIPSNGVQTRSVAEDFGKGTLVNRCILEIYRGDALYSRIEKGVTDGAVTFDDLRLVASQTYDFVFWADCAEGNETNGFEDKTYVTENGLTNITEKGAFVGNSDQRDAFFFCLSKEVTGTFSEPVKLYRPFGLLTVKTLDLSAIGEQSLKPTKYTAKFKALPNAFNARTGETSGSTDVAYTAELAKTDGTVSMDFLWAGTDKADLADFSMTFYNGETEITTNDNFKNIPIRRNYKTNVSGNLLTKKGSVNVTISPDFADEEYDEVVTEVATVDDVAAAIEAGATNIVVTEAPMADATVEIPCSFTEADAVVSITLPETTAQVTVAYTNETANAPAAVSITIPNAENLVIDLPESTVTLNGETYGSVTATTAENTLIIPEGVAVETLTVNKGNVEIYGKVAAPITFNEGAGVVKVYGVGDAATLKAAAALVAAGKCAKIVLTADIDLEGSAENPWTPINTEKSAFTEFDGGGHTLSNLWADNYTGHPDGVGYYYGGFFYVLGGTVRNLTIDGATVTCQRGGALVGRMDYGLVENCHVKNVTINGYQKVAGLIGFVSSASKDVTVRGCSVNGCTINNNVEGEGLYQAGGLIGYLQTFDRNVLVEDNSVSGISFRKVYESAADAADKVWDMEQYYSHAFIGSIANFSKTEGAYDKYTVELRNNTVAQQVGGIPTCDRTDDYIGWWAGDYNTSGYLYSTKVVVDGVAKDRWIEAKRLAAQIAAGGHVNVWRSYDFTKCGELPEEIAITEPTTLELKNGALFTVGKQQLVNRSELTVKGPGAMAATDYIFMNESGATLTVESGAFTATKATDANGVVIYNQGICHIKDGTFDGPGFALMNTGSADMTIDGGSVLNQGNPTGYALMAAGSSAKLTVNGGKIDAIQSIGGANVTINDGTIYNDCKYYALYNEGGKTTINGGYFSGFNGMKDVYIDSGTVTIKGGFFEDNQAPAAAGYVYRDNVQTVDGITYNYEVVAE